MDAGVAAVLGTAVGAAGTSLAAILTGWFSKSQTSRQLRADLEKSEMLIRAEREKTEAAIRAEQVKSEMVIRAEHLRSRREPRSLAYSEFIGCTKNTQTMLRDLWHQQLADSDQGEAAYESQRSELQLLDLRAARVAVEGPAIVGSVALSLASQAWTCYYAVLHIGPGEQSMEHVHAGDNAIDELTEVLDVFITEASGALDEDGASRGH
ncbi:hypothetical protein [Kitasatospora sp. NPDC093806]|uniref:hypothetical protein n=1 Tax=Kitasatospora sp. NPDC093806 TaxID=3155075 RepID=UPI0034306FF9